MTEQAAESDAVSARPITIRPVRQHEVAQCVHHGRAFFESRKLCGEFIPDRFIAFWNGLLQSGMGTIIGAWRNEDLLGGIGGGVYPEPYSGVLVAQEMFWWFPNGGRSAVRLVLEFESWAGRQGAWSVGLARFADTPRVGELYGVLGYRESDVYHKKELRHA